MTGSGRSGGRRRFADTELFSRPVSLDTYRRISGHSAVRAARRLWRDDHVVLTVDAACSASDGYEMVRIPDGLGSRRTGRTVTVLPDPREGTGQPGSSSARGTSPGAARRSAVPPEDAAHDTLPWEHRTMNVDRGHLRTDLPPDEEHAPRRRITVEDLRTHHDEIVAIGRRYGVSNIRVFGSVARGEADERSDLDLLIDVAPGHGYFDMTGFALDVEQLMGVFTQVATPNGLKKRMQARILAEALPL